MSSCAVFSQYGVQAFWNKGAAYSVGSLNYPTEAQAIHAAQRKAARLLRRLRIALSRAMREDLSATELAEVRRLNASPEYVARGACASHNFMDANMTMLRAFVGEFGREPDLQGPDLDLINDAWTAAREEGFTA